MEGDRKYVEALARGLELLACFNAQDGLLSNGELAKKTALPKSTVTRLTHTLACCGYLRHDAVSNRYALDTAAFSLAQAFLSGHDLLAILREPMRDVARQVGAAVSIGCRDGLDVMYLETIRTETALTLGLAAGSRLSMLTSSMGRAYLAVARPDERETLLAALRADHAAQSARLGMDLERAISEAMAAVQMYAEVGYCVSFQAWHGDVNAVAVPFYDAGSHRFLVLSCSAPASSFSPAVFETDIAPRLQAIVRRHVPGHPAGMARESKGRLL